MHDTCTNPRPIYASLVNRIREDILGGRILQGQMIGTEVGLAAEGGISRSSVRLGIDDLVREGLVERRPGKGVFACKAPPGARTVEIVLPNLGGMWADLAYGAQDRGVRQGIKLHIYNANRDFEADVRAIHLLPASGVAGAIIASLHRNRMSQSLVRLWQTGFPFVLCDQRMQDIDVSSVVFDNHRAGYLAARELLHLGHRRIAFAGYLVPGLSGSRLEGFRDALNDAGIAFDRKLAAIQPVDADLPPREPSFEAFFTTLATQPDRPSAIVFHSEDLAAEGCRILKRQGLRIPQDLSVAVIGRPCGLFDTPLARVDLPFDAMGQAALDMLLRRLDHPDSPVEHRVVPVRWVPGESAQAWTGM